MRLLEDLLAATVMIGRAGYAKAQLQRLLPGVAVVAGLVIMAAVSASAMLIGGFYAGYSAMLYYGIRPLDAGIIALLLLTAVTGCFVLLAMTCLQRLQRRSPLTTRTTDVVDAFIDGLMTKT